jgi:hypothetical protein
MVKAVLALAAVVTLAIPATSHACANGVAWTVDDDVRLVRRAETQFEDGRFASALKTLRGLRFSGGRLRERALDITAMSRIRMGDVAGYKESIERLEARDAAAEHKDIKLYAWRAEAYVAINKREQAKAILDDLLARDLIPDAYGYLALAKLTSGSTRLEMWKQCRTRAKDKDICELPKEVVSRAAK